MQNIKDIFERFMNTEGERLNLCLPIAFALGIIVYFALPTEPALWWSLGMLVVCAGVFYFLKNKNNGALLFLFLTFFAAGFARITLQTRIEEAPFIHKKYSFVTVIGKVEKLEWYSNAQRLTLGNLYMDKIPIHDMPVKIRVRINGHKSNPKVGDTVYLKATLMPPTLPFIPNGYPYARTAYFNQLGAVGYAVSKIKIINQAPVYTGFLEKIRLNIRNYLTQTLPPEQAGVAVSLVTGEQGLVFPQIRENYTTAGIVHILSVSGFHMTLIAGFVFLLFRLLFSLFPTFLARYNTKKICALLALFLTFFYLLISGMALPAVRSFGMIALVLIGVMCDRRVFSIHSVFWIGFLMLLISPESIMSASFALSFGAVIALVSSYESFYPALKNFFANKPKPVKYVLFPLLVLFLMNLIAHTATAPIAMYHFHRYANYAMLGNFLTDTLFSVLIMPLLFCGVVLIPFGVAMPFIWSIGYLLSLVNSITVWISQLPAANIFIPSFSDVGYAFILLGGTWLFLWKSKIKWAGLVFVALGFSSVFFYQVPDILINQGGSLWAIKTQDNSFLFSTLTKSKSTRRTWLESMGYPTDTKAEKIKDIKAIQTVKRIRIDFNGNAESDAKIVFNTRHSCRDKICIPKGKLWKEGTHAVYIQQGVIQIKTATDKMQNRPWSQGVYLDKGAAAH